MQCFPQGSKFSTFTPIKNNITEISALLTRQSTYCKAGSIDRNMLTIKKYLISNKAIEGA